MTAKVAWNAMCLLTYFKKKKKVIELSIEKNPLIWLGAHHINTNDTL